MSFVPKEDFLSMVKKTNAKIAPLAGSIPTAAVRGVRIVYWANMVDLQVRCTTVIDWCWWYFS